MGSPGQKGEQGIEGVPRPRGIPGAKGEPGESISSPTVVISPINQTVKENQSAVFQCSVSGNPKPTVTWLKWNSSVWTDRFGNGPAGTLEVRHVTLEDAGKFICVARNMLGFVNQSAILIVEGKKFNLLCCDTGSTNQCYSPAVRFACVKFPSSRNAFEKKRCGTTRIVAVKETTLKGV